MMRPNRYLYPIEDLPTTIRAAVEEAIQVSQAPAALVATAALSAASLSVHAKFDVRRMNGLVSPTSLYTQTFAESGERKSTIDRIFFEPFSNFENTHNGKDEGTKFQILYSDTSPQALIFGLFSKSRYAGFNEDEGGRIFSSTIPNDLGLLNKLWDGRDITVDRKSGNFKVIAPRVTINWMVQPSIFRKYMERKGDDARGIGFLARCLVCFPDSTQGSRFIKKNISTGVGISNFHKRALAMLEDQRDLLKSKASECLAKNRLVLDFAPEALAELENTYNQIEHSIQPGGVFCENRDYASKVAENIARVAGVFHAFEDCEGTSISRQTLKSATSLVLWYAQEFIRLFSPPDPLEEIERDALLLDEWLIKLVRSRGMFNYLEKNFLMQRGPNQLRNKDRLRWALERLQQSNRLQIQYLTNNYGRHRKTVIILNNEYYGNIARGVTPYGYFPILS